MWRPVRVAFERNRWNGDDRHLCEPLLELVVISLAFCEAQSPTIIVNHDVDVIRIIKGGCASFERGIVKVPLRRCDFPYQLRKVMPVLVVTEPPTLGGKTNPPINGQPFPDGSKIVKLQWKPKKSTEAPFVVDVPDVFTQAFVIEKDSKRFPNSGGWGYALFNYEAASDKFTADPSPSDCGHACHVAVKAKDHIFHPYQKR